MIKIIFFGFILRLFIAFWNGFFGPSFGAELDAATFHRVAVEYSENLTFDGFQIGWIYSYILGLIYSVTGSSLFLGSLLSCFAWLISAFFLLKSIKLLDVSRKNKKWILLIYSLLPSSILYTSVTLREPYQLLFITITIYAALNIIIKKRHSSWWLLLVGCIGSSLLHGALMGFSLILIAMTLFFNSSTSGRKSKWIKITFAIPIIILILIYGISLFSNSFYQLNNGIANAVQNYQEGGLAIEARTNYKTEVSISGWTGLITFIPTSIFQYLFEPMPWRMSSVVDIPIFLENALRFWLIWITVKYYHSSNLPKYRKQPVLFLMLAYFVIETIWSLGTINWGTASRHHIPSNSILFMMAFVLKSQYKKRKVKQ